ncbi:MAG: hypothetical protein EBR82_22595 [Caulobacteraceae bacterium]|nr:hypothetical protein [Caulobacteraceae bacterium]
MTNEQMDRLAAIEIMKWELLPGHRELLSVDVYLSTNESHTPNDEPLEASVWSPTTNEAHAALVREKMRADGWALVIEADHFGLYRVEWSRFEADNLFASRFTRWWDTLPLALTTAALLAVGACKEEEING